MNESYSRVRAEVDLDAIIENMNRMHSRLPEGTKMVGIIKADGYGHGCERIGQALEELPYVWGYGVATADEALELRSVPLKKPILVLGCVFPDQYESMILNDVRINVYTEGMAGQVAACAEKAGKKAYVHFKIDTGMSRIGFDCTEESVDAIAAAAADDRLICEGIFTHFSKADEVSKDFTHGQIRAFDSMIGSLRQRGVEFECTHASNSAGIIDFPDLTYTMVRAGISLYGLYPSDDVNHKDVRLKQALSLKSHVIMVKTIAPGARVSYGGDFTADKPMRIATVPVGYGDGYPRSLSGKSSVLIHGRRAPVLGRICMDQFMVDVSHIPDVRFGDDVVLIGEDGGESISVDELAKLSGRFNYEFTCDLNKRIPRIYLSGGEAVASLDFFDKS